MINRVRCHGKHLCHRCDTVTPHPVLAHSDSGPSLSHLDFCVILLQSSWLLCNLFYNYNSVCTLLCTFYYKNLKISLKSSLSTQSLCHTISSRVGVGVPQKNKDSACLLNSGASEWQNSTVQCVYCCVHGLREVVGIVFTRKVETVHLSTVTPLVKCRRRLVVFQRFEYRTVYDNLNWKINRTTVV